MGRADKDKANLAYLLEALAAVIAFEGEGWRSALLLGAAEALLEEVGVRVYNCYIPDRSLYESTVATVRSQLGGAAFEEARAEVQAMTVEQAVECTLGVRA